MSRRRPSFWPRPLIAPIAAGAAVTLGCGFGGWALASQIAAEPSAAPVLDRLVTAGPARLKVSTAWQRASRPPELPGLGKAPAFMPYAGLTTTVTVAVVPPEHAALLPSELVRAAGGRLPRAERARIVGLEARAYRGIPAGASVLDVYAIPTTRGVLTLACRARDDAPEAPTWCLNGLEQITVQGGRPLKVDDGVAYRMRAPTEVRKLDAVRVRERRALRRAKGPVGQGRAARALEAAYARTAARLAPVAAEGDPSARVVSALRDASQAYRKLARVAALGDQRGWRRARVAVDRAERALRARVDAA